MICIDKPMPKCCDECFALDDNGDYPFCLISQEQRGYTFPIREKRMPNCPLITIDKDHISKEELRKLQLLMFLTLDLRDMRNPTEEEKESVNEYIEKHSIKTGVNIFDILEEPNKNCSTCGYPSHSFACDTCEGYSNWWSLE